MHVLMTADTLGGVFSHATTLCSWLVARGVRVTLATMGRAPSADQERMARRAGARLVPSSYKLEWMADPWSDVERAGEWLLELERRLRPDLVHLNGYAHGALPFRAPVIVVAHSCVLSWWRAVLGEPAGAEYARYRREVCRGLNGARIVIAPSLAMAQCLQREYDFGRARVIHNGVPAMPAAQGKEPIILCAGRIWDSAKNIQLVASAARASSWPVLVAGEQRPPEGQPLEPLASVRPLGNLSCEELWAWMRRSAVFAAPARYEPFGLSILEAAANSCALVLGDIPSLRELWQDAAVFVDPTSTASLECALGELAENDRMRASLGERAKLRARRYRADRMGAAYLRAYESLVRSGDASNLMETWS